MVGSNSSLREPSPATDLDGIMTCQGWGLQVAGFVTVEEYRYACSGNLRKLPELACRYSSTVAP